MNTVEALRQKNTERHMIEGRSYLCRRYTSLVAVQVFGVAAFAQVQAMEAAAKKKELTDDEALAAWKSRREMKEKVLRGVMVEPRIVDIDQGLDNEVTFDLMDDDVDALFNMVMGVTAEKTEGFTEPSEDSTE